MSKLTSPTSSYKQTKLVTFTCFLNLPPFLYPCYHCQGGNFSLIQNVVPQFRHSSPPTWQLFSQWTPGFCLLATPITYTCLHTMAWRIFLNYQTPHWIQPNAQILLPESLDSEWPQSPLGTKTSWRPKKEISGTTWIISSHLHGRRYLDDMGKIKLCR